MLTLCLQPSGQNLSNQDDSLLERHWALQLPTTLFDPVPRLITNQFGITAGALEVFESVS